MISSKFDGALWLSQSLVTRLGVCVQNNLNANLTALRAFCYDVLLLTAAYSDYAGHFFLGKFPNMELLLLLLSLYSLLNSLYFPGWWNITLFLTGCLCALNYMSKPDHLILIDVEPRWESLPFSSRLLVALWVVDPAYCKKKANLSVLSLHLLTLVGKHRKNWMRGTVSDVGMMALRAVKEKLDPDNIFGNQNLI